MHIPPTSKHTYIGGLAALNLPVIGRGTSTGDWHKEGTWWTPNYLDGTDRPFRCEMRGRDGNCEAPPGLPRLLDARASLASIDHPAGGRPEPVWAATMPQAVIDLAWDGVDGSIGITPSRRDVYRWLDPDDELVARQIATRIEHSLRIDPDRLENWRTWMDEAFAEGDGYHEIDLASSESVRRPTITISCPTP